jgi:hypothetical protein
MADGGLLLGAFCVCAVFAVIPTALCAAAAFGAPPQPAYGLGWQQRRPLMWRSYGADYYPPPCGPYDAQQRTNGGGSAGGVYVRVPAPTDGVEYLVVRADVFAEQQQPRQRQTTAQQQPGGEGEGASASGSASAPAAAASETAGDAAAKEE